MGTRYNRFFGPVRDAMMRWLFWFVVLLAVVWWVRRRFFAADSSGPSGAGGVGRKQRKSSGEAESMVQCARCGVFVPASEAVRADGQTFCCEAHRQEGARARK